jgi:hypothetical protein
MVGGAIVSVLLVVVVWWFCTRSGQGRGTPSGRLIACLIVILASLVIIGIESPSTAGALVAGFATGIGTFFKALAGFFSRF